jgi:hypothetical protein
MGHCFDLSEPGLSILKECHFIGDKTIKRSAGTRWATAEAGVYWA